MLGVHDLHLHNTYCLQHDWPRKQCAGQLTVQPGKTHSCCKWYQYACVQKSAELDKYIQLLCEARKKKGLTEQQARDNLTDMNVFGTLMVLADDADGMVSGATTTTANTIRPALQASNC